MAETHYFTRDFNMTDAIGEEALRNPLPRKNGQAMPQFYTKDEVDHAKTAALGRKAYRKIDMVRIVIPGDPQNQVERRVREDDKLRWPRQYEAYRKMEEFVPDGTLLDTWPMLSKEQVSDLKHNQIFTVEQLAEVPDDLLRHIGLGARLLREHAKAFIETAAKGAVPSRLVEDNERLRNQVTLLTDQLSQLTKKVEQFAVKAGETIEDMDNPVVTAKAKEVIQQASDGRNNFVVVPKDYKNMGLPALRELCQKIDSGSKILTKQQAFTLIEEYEESKV